MIDDLLDQFVHEGRDLLQQAAQGILALEAGDRASLDGANRAFHTLKGSAALFGFAPLEAVLHAAEDLTDAIRSGRVAVTADIADPLLATVGTIERWIEAIALAGSMPGEIAAEAPALVARLRPSLQGAGPGATPLAPRGTTTDAGDAPVHHLASRLAMSPAPEWLPALLLRRPPGSNGPLTALRYRPTADCFFRGDDPLGLLRGVPGLVAVDVRLPAGLSDATLAAFTCHVEILAFSTAPPDDIHKVFRFVPDQVEFADVPPRGPDGAVAPPPRERTVRVDVARIERLADIAGELLVAKNRLGHLARLAETNPAGLARALQENLAEMERLARELHRAVSAVRMVRLGHTLRLLPRLVRETASRLGRSVTLDIEGEGTEAEKRIADGLFEPLLHTVRNAIDHGIEPPPARLAAGKPPEGRIAVHASQSGDRIVVDVTDDGAGIDPAVIRAAAVARGLIEPQAADALSDEGAIDLLFTPGFSTAGTVSAVSGRGVGLDAVRSSLALLGGRVDIASRLGAGTTVRFTIPRATVVTTLITVDVGGQSFGVPIDGVSEILHLPAVRIACVGETAAFALRGNTVPLLPLATLLGLPLTPRSGADAKVLVAQHGTGLVGFEVAGFGERVDAVVRPPHGLLAGLPGLLGNFLLGDGTVMLVLDLATLVP